MPTIPNPSSTPPAFTILDLLTDANIETGQLAVGETLEAADLQFTLRKYNALLDEWAARKVYAYAMAFTLYTLGAGHGPTLIGPGLVAPDFAVAQRPTKIEGFSIVLNTTPTAVDVPGAVRDAQWWNFQRVKTLQSSIPTDLYYEPDFPNGQLNFWPIPNIAYQVRLQTWVLLSQISDITLPFQMPPAYRNAMLYTLAERLCPSFGCTPNQQLVKQAMDARKAAQINNDGSPRTTTTDTGMPNSRSRGNGGFNWLDGSPW